MNPNRLFQPALMRACRYSVLLLSPAIYLVACALASCLAAYPLHFVTGDFLGFHTLTSRGALFAVVIGLVFLGRRLGMTRADFGLAPGNREFFAHLRIAFGVGVLMLTLHFCLLVWLDARGVNLTKLELARFVRMAWKGLLIGVAVGVFEETVFRGALLGMLRRHLPSSLAVLATAFYFALLHFLHSDMRFAPEQIRWDSSFRFALDSFANLGHIRLDSFLALFTAGIFLSCLRLALPQGLAWCIGIHAGWVFVIKTLKPFTYGNRQSEWFFLVSPFDGVIGYLSAGWIIVLILALAFRQVRQSVPAPAR